MLLDRCLSAPCVLSVCNIDVLWSKRWMDKDETWHGVGLGPGHIVLDGEPAPLPQRGTAPIFGSCLLWLDGSRCHLARR